MILSEGCGELSVSGLSTNAFRSVPDLSSGPDRLRELVTYYERKTGAILQRYGPGPRVHFHTGLIDRFEPCASSADLRTQLVQAQERMLRYAVDSWQIGRTPFREVLDVGCGLGGGAIFWAQHFGSRITAVTIAPSHIELIASFAAQAAVSSLIQPLLCDALTVPGENRFDAAVAIDSSSSFPRGPWFHRLAGLLRPKGRVFVFDCFLERPEYEAPFNHHWCAQITTLDEYLDAARRVGFELEKVDDVSERALHFWSTTLALLDAEAREKNLDSAETAKAAESARVHALVRRGLLDGGLRHVLLSFVKS